MLDSSYTLGQCKEALSVHAGHDLLALVREALIYERLTQSAGPRPWNELEAWSHISNSYVRSQLFLIERQASEYPREANLMEVVKFASVNAQSFNRLDAKQDALPDMPAIPRVAIDHFTAAERAADRRRLENVRLEIADLSRMQPDYDHSGFVLRCQAQGSDESGFRMPVYPELRSAVDALFDVWLKYARILTGRPYTHLDHWPQPELTRIIEPLVADWRSRDAAL